MAARRKEVVIGLSERETLAYGVAEVRLTPEEAKIMASVYQGPWRFDLRALINKGLLDPKVLSEWAQNPSDFLPEAVMTRLGRYIGESCFLNLR